MQRWYREQLRAQLPPLLEKWEPKLGVSVNEVRIKKMKTIWGSCNIEAKRIWRFRELMDGFLPQWRAYRHELNRAPLAHEDWRY